MIGVKQWLALSFISVAFLLFIVGFSTQFWYYEDNPLGDEFYYGLWRTCSYVAGISTSCSDWVDIPNTQDYLKVVQAFETVGLILLFTGYVLLLVHLFAKLHNNWIKYSAIIMFLVAASFILAGVIVFGVESPQNIVDNLGFSYFFVVVSIGLILIGEVFILLFKN